jgi:hypothetical protein
VARVWSVNSPDIQPNPRFNSWPLKLMQYDCNMQPSQSKSSGGMYFSRTMLINSSSIQFL